MKKSESLLDEMQEQKLLTIEHNMAWLAFWGLLAAMVIQLFAFGPAHMETVLGEWIVFMAQGGYLTVSCVKNGIWDRKLRPDRSTNFHASLIGAGAVFTATTFFVWRNTGDWGTSLIAAAVLGLVAFLLCFGALALALKLYKKRVSQMEEQAED